MILIFDMISKLFRWKKKEANDKSDSNHNQTTMHVVYGVLVTAGALTLFTKAVFSIMTQKQKCSSQQTPASSPSSGNTYSLERKWEENEQEKISHDKTIPDDQGGTAMGTSPSTPPLTAMEADLYEWYDTLKEEMCKTFKPLMAKRSRSKVTIKDQEEEEDCHPPERTLPILFPAVVKILKRKMIRKNRRNSEGRNESDENRKDDGHDVSISVTNQTTYQINFEEILEKLNITAQLKSSMTGDQEGRQWQCLCEIEQYLLLVCLEHIFTYQFKMAPSSGDFLLQLDVFESKENKDRKENGPADKDSFTTENNNANEEQEEEVGAIEQECDDVTKINDWLEIIHDNQLIAKLEGHSSGKFMLSSMGMFDEDLHLASASTSSQNISPSSASSKKSNFSAKIYYQKLLQKCRRRLWYLHWRNLKSLIFWLWLTAGRKIIGGAAALGCAVILGKLTNLGHVHEDQLEEKVKGLMYCLFEISEGMATRRSRPDVPSSSVEVAQGHRHGGNNSLWMLQLGITVCKNLFLFTPAFVSTTTPGDSSTTINQKSQSEGGDRDTTMIKFTMLCSDFLRLCRAEIFRRLAVTVIEYFTKRLINKVTASHREAMKQKTFEALCCTPMEYFDFHSYEELEEILFYANDLEGVDIHVQTAIVSVCSSCICCQTLVLQNFGGRSGRGRKNSLKSVLVLCILLFTSKAVDSGSQWMLKKLAVREDITDAEAMESAIVGGGGRGVPVPVLLSGMQIFQHVRALRPLGADRLLMEEWMEYSSHRGNFSSSPSSSSPQLASPHNKSSPTQKQKSCKTTQKCSSLFSKIVKLVKVQCGPFTMWFAQNAVPSITRWAVWALRSSSDFIQILLPLLASHLSNTVNISTDKVVSPSSSSSSSSNSNSSSPREMRSSMAALHTYRAIDQLCAEILHCYSLWEIVQLNAYKAHILLDILDQKNWETTKPFLTSNIGGGEDPQETKTISQFLNPFLPSPPVSTATPSPSSKKNSKMKEDEEGELVVEQIHDKKKKGKKSSSSLVSVQHRRVVAPKCVRLHHVSFSYPTRPDHWILKNISLEIPLQGLTVIAGASGCGKSTLLALLLKIYPLKASSSSFSSVSHHDKKVLPTSLSSGSSQMHFSSSPNVGAEKESSVVVARSSSHNVKKLRRNSIEIEFLIQDHDEIREEEEEDDDENKERRNNSGGGCQKTTPVAMLLSMDLNDIPTTILRGTRSGLFSYVPQTVPIFNGTVAQNIALQSSRTVSLANKALIERVKRAAKGSGAHEFIEALPEGYFTYVGEQKTIKLSGGQCQRIGIARALFRGEEEEGGTEEDDGENNLSVPSCAFSSSSSSILLMDEPTSALDLESKKKVIQMLQELSSSSSSLEKEERNWGDEGKQNVKPRRGVLCISHDEDMVKAADHVIRLGKK